MNKLAACVCCKHFIQLKSIIDIFIVHLHAFFKPIRDNIGHLVGKQSHIWQINVITRIVQVLQFFLLSFLLINISPVEYLIVLKMSIRYCLKWCPR